VGIAADETFVKPMITVPRLTVEQERYEIACAPDRVMMECQENGSISTQRFEKWVPEVLRPHLDDVRKLRAERNHNSIQMLLIAHLSNLLCAVGRSSYDTLFGRTNVRVVTLISSFFKSK
jgi:hypothetical protein